MKIKASEVWIQLHYRYKENSYKFNLPLPKGNRTLEGLTLNFESRTVVNGQRLIVTVIPMGEIEIESFVLTGNIDCAENLTSVFANGYQSWTESREHTPDERISHLHWPGRFLALHRLGDATFQPYPERRGYFHGYSYVYLRYSNHLFLACSLDESDGYTIIDVNIRDSIFSLSKDLVGLCLTEKKKVLEIALLEGEENSVFDSYARMHRAVLLSAERAFGWISSPSDSHYLNELSIRRNLAAFREKNIPLDYFIIGDGWQSTLGEWHIPSSGFPSGMSSLCVEICGSGYRPGLWFAPFVTAIDSTIFRTRKDWLAREPGKTPKPAGRRNHINGIYYSLDLFRTDVRAYIEESYRRITETWNYQFISLDLLYVAGLYPRSGLSRGGAMNEAMDFLFSLKKGETWLANATPMDACFGRAEYIRVATESSVCWEKTFLRKIHLRERTSTCNALHSIIGRHHLNGRLTLNAGSSFHLESQHKGMDPRQRYTHLLLSIILGSFVSTSDYIENYSDEEKSVFSSLFPLVQPHTKSVDIFQHIVTVKYNIGIREYMSFSNISEKTHSFQIPKGNWFCPSPFGSRPHHIAGGMKQQLKPGESRNYLHLKKNDHFAGSNGHIFPGAEIASITYKNQKWKVCTRNREQLTFRIWLRIPPETDSVNNTNKQFTINNQVAEITTTPLGETLATAKVGETPSKAKIQ